MVTQFATSKAAEPLRRWAQPDTDLREMTESWAAQLKETIDAAGRCRLQDTVEAVILLGAKQVLLQQEVSRTIYGPDESIDPEAIWDAYRQVVLAGEVQVVQALKACWR